MVDAVHEGPLDVLVSYRHEDGDFAEMLVERLNRQFDVRCFFDQRMHVEGFEWMEFWRQHLRHTPTEADPRLGPSVVVLATEAIFNRREPIDHVAREISDAIDLDGPGHRIPISIISFTPNVITELQRSLDRHRRKEGRVEFDLNAIHRHDQIDNVPVGRPRAISEATWMEICRAVVRSARASLVRRLQKERHRTMGWASQISSRKWIQGGDGSFSRLDPVRGTLGVALDASTTDREIRRLAVIGDGGVGKTTQVAETLLQILQDDPNRFFPILVDSGDLADNCRTLRKRRGLGADAVAEPLNLIEEYAWARGRLFFVADSLERADKIEETARQLRALNDNAALWITCRPQAWRAANDILAFDELEVVEIKEIGDIDAAQFLEKGRDGEFIRARPYLRNAVFLDTAAHLLRYGGLTPRKAEAALRNQTTLLDALEEWATMPESGCLRGPAVVAYRRGLLAELANLQIRHGRFEIAYDELIGSAAIDASDWKEAFAYLTEQKKFMIEELAPDQPRKVRLRHDVIDSHNISCVVLDDPSSRQALYRRMDLGFGQLAFSGVVQSAHDRERNEVTDEFFAYFLRMVDNKRRVELKPQGWNSGYVISARLPVFLRHILQVLGGEYLGAKLPAIPGAAVSALDPPRLTEGALSSVASMLIAAKPLSIADARGEWLARLSGFIPITEYRGRLIEALAKIDNCEAAIAMLRQLADDHQEIALDQPIAVYIATALESIAAEAPDARAEIIDILSRLVSLFERQIANPDLPIVRLLHRARNAVQRLLRRASFEEPGETEQEFIEGLRLHAWNERRRFSDWTMVEYYANRIKSKAGRIDGKLSERVILALGCVLWHEHTMCHEFAARALGDIDHPLARGLLLHAVSFEENERTVSEIFEALRCHINRIKSDLNTARAFRRSLIRAAAERNGRVRDGRMNELRELVLEFGLAD